MAKWLRSLFARVTVKETIIWKYQRNTITGKRRANAKRVEGTLGQPLDIGCLDGGEFNSRPLPAKPPRH